MCPRGAERRVQCWLDWYEESSCYYKRQVEGCCSSASCEPEVRDQERCRSVVESRAELDAPFQLLLPQEWWLSLSQWSLPRVSVVKEELWVC